MKPPWLDRGLGLGTRCKYMVAGPIAHVPVLCARVGKGKKILIRHSNADWVLE